MGVAQQLKEPEVASFVAGTAVEWTPREPVLLGTRIHFVPKTVGGRVIKAPQRSGGKGRPAKAQEAYWVSRDVTRP